MGTTAQFAGNLGKKKTKHVQRQCKQTSCQCFSNINELITARSMLSKHGFFLRDW